MLPLYSFTFFLIVACAVFFYRAGEYEQSSGVAWALLSVVVSLIVWQALKGGFVAVFLGQLGLFGAITAYRVWRSR